MKPFLTRRKNGIWYIVETDSSGKRRWLSTNQKNRRGAERLLERLNPTDQIPMGGMPISQFLSDLLSHLQPSYAPATIVIYESAIRNLIANVGDISITTVTARDIDQFKTARLAQVSPVSVNIELRTIKAAFNIALRWELITSNPFKGVKQVRIPDRLPTYLSRSQWIALDARLNGVWIHPIIIFAVNTGMRQGEILNLEWSQVDLARRVVHVCSTSTFKTKTGKSRIVPLNETAHAVLLNLPTKGELVFTRDGRPILPNSITHAFKRAVRAAGLPEAIHFHSLRHTFASWLVQDGVSLYQVGRLLGHTDTKTTEIYAHLQPETMHDVVDRLKMG